MTQPEPERPTVGAGTREADGPSAAQPTVGGASGAAAEAGAVAVQVATTTAVSSVATPLVGKAAGVVAGKAARSKVGRNILISVIAFLTALLLATVLIITSVVISVSGAVSSILSGSGSATDSCYGSGITLGNGAVDLDPEQTANFNAIMQEVEARGLTAADAVIAVMTADTESTLYNVNHGDAVGPDSRGLFQQREGWGPYEVRMDPRGATGLFLNSLTDPNLKKYRTSEPLNSTPTSRHDTMPWLVAQSVQRSAYDNGENYRAKYERAVSLVTSVLGEEQMAQAKTDYWSQFDADGNHAGGSLILPGTGDDDPFGLGTNPDDPFGLGAGSGLGSVFCGGGAEVGVGPTGPGPGQWGGHQNGRIPADALAPIPWAPSHSLRADATAALIRLNEAYRAQFGTNIAITDSYRSFEGQVAMKNSWCARGACHMAAPPGTSNHGWGLALDLGGGINRFGTPQHEWMVANAPSAGWVHPEWAKQGKGKPEPWHFEFNGLAGS